MTTRRHFADLPATPRPHRQPQGLDYQGRHHEAAHAATDMGVEPHDLADQRLGLGGTGRKCVELAVALAGEVFGLGARPRCWK